MSAEYGDSEEDVKLSKAKLENEILKRQITHLEDNLDHMNRRLHDLNSSRKKQHVDYENKLSEFREKYPLLESENKELKVEVRKVQKELKESEKIFEKVNVMTDKEAYRVGFKDGWLARGEM